MKDIHGGSLSSLFYSVALYAIDFHAVIGTLATFYLLLLETDF